MKTHKQTRQALTLAEQAAMKKYREFQTALFHLKLAQAEHDWVSWLKRHKVEQRGER